MTTDYGTITHNGNTITLTNQAYLTNRVLTEYADDLQYNGSGDSYMTEWAAAGIDEAGQSVRVYWHFEVAREDKTVVGDYDYNTEADGYDWDNVYAVVADPDSDLRTAAAVIGRKGGSATTEAKRAASAANGRKGGRPKKQ